MSSALPLLSPLVTRILEISGFPPELKTRDIQAIFSQWEDDRGGFRIKWVDDTTALVIFADAAPAKRAYLQTLMSPPPSLMTSTGVPAKIRPYDGDDASMIIASVQNRPRSRSNAGGQATPAYGGTGSSSEDVTATPSRSNNNAVTGGSPRTIGRTLGSGHRRNQSGSNPSSLPAKPLAAALFDAANGGPSPAHHLANAVAAEAAEIAAAAEAAGDTSPEFTHNGQSIAALKNLPMNPMASAPRSTTAIGGDVFTSNGGALGLGATPELKKSSSSNGGAAAAAANATEVV